MVSNGTDLLELFYLALTLVGFGQGVVMALGLSIAPPTTNDKSLPFLIWLVTCMALENLRIFILNSKVTESYPFLIFLATSCSLALGPLIWFYIKSWTAPNFRFRSRDYLHFVPLLIEVIIHVPVYRSMMSNPIVGKDIMTAFQFGPQRMWIQILAVGSLAFYLFQALKLYNRALAVEKGYYSNEKIHRWLGYFLWSCILMVFYFFGISAIDILIFNYGLSVYFYYPMSIGLTIIICWISWTHWQLESGPANSNEKAIRELRMEPANTPESDLTESMQALTQFMTNHKPHLNPELTLDLLATELGVPAKQLTRTLNRGFNQHFFDFINGYRVDAIKKSIEQGRHEQITLLAIALECGFNSKSAFNRVFKKNTGMTPREYQQSHYKK